MLLAGEVVLRSTKLVFRLSLLKSKLIFEDEKSELEVLHTVLCSFSKALQNQFGFDSAEVRSGGIDPSIHCVSCKDGSV